MNEVDRKAARGVGWMIGARVFVRLIDLATLGVAARLLTPEDFGVFALASVIVAFVDLLGALSSDLSLIQKQDAERRHYDAAWTMSFLQRSGAALLIAALAFPAARFLDAESVSFVMLWLALGTFIEAFQNIGLVDFRKKLELQKDFAFEAVKKLSAAAGTMGAALALGDFRALVAGVVLGKLMGVVLSYRMHPFRPRFGLDGARELFGFSKWIFVNQSVSFVNHKFDELAVGKISGTSVAGHYMVAYDLANAATTEIVYPASRAMFPAYAKVASTAGMVQRYFLSVFGFVALLTVPVGLGLCAVAEPLILALLGPDWRDAITILRLFAIGGVLNALMACAGPVYPALGRPELAAWLAVARAALAVPLSILAILEAGALGGALVALFLSVGFVPAVWIVARPLLDLPVTALGKVAWRPFAGGTAMFLVLWAGRGVAPELSPWAALSSRVVLGGLLYCGTVLAAWWMSGAPPGAEAYVLQRVVPGLGTRAERKD